MGLLEILFLILLGLTAGFIGSIVGMGGGFLFVPIFYYVLNLEIHKSIGTSLFVIPFLSSSAAFTYLKKKMVDVKTALIFEISTVPGASLGAYLTIFLSPDVLKALFGAVLIVGALKLVLSAYSGEQKKNHTSNDKIDNPRAKNKSSWYILERRIVSSDGHVFEYEINIFKLPLLGLGAGMISGLLGVGGGTVKVPIMIFLLGMPPYVAAATSTFMIIFTAISAATTHYFIGNVVIEIAIYTVIGSVIGAQIGARIASKIKQRIYRAVIGSVLLVVSVRMLLESLLSYL
ncbi:MAG: sulfite exporter TauE/SafE family protein [Candidatus Asgardarchaeia archaeon]